MEKYEKYIPDTDSYLDLCWNICFYTGVKWSRYTSKGNNFNNEILAFSIGATLKGKNLFLEANSFL